MLANRFGVSLHFAARRLDDLGLWKHSVGMWELRREPHQKWYVGRRLWHRPPTFAAFDLAKASIKSVSTIENIPSGDHEILVALQMLNLGRNIFLGLISTSNGMYPSHERCAVADPQETPLKNIGRC
jgi:hypothetical protein